MEPSFNVYDIPARCVPFVPERNVTLIIIIMVVVILTHTIVIIGTLNSYTGQTMTDNDGETVSN